MELEIKELRDRVLKLEAEIVNLRIAVAEKNGAQRATAWWAVGTALLIATWLGASSQWHIPRVVRDELAKTAAGKAADKAIANINELKAAFEKGRIIRLKEADSEREIGLSSNEYPVTGGSGHALVRLPEGRKGSNFKLLVD